MTLKIDYKSITLESSGRLMHGIVTGKLEKEDYDILVPEAERLINQYGKIRIIAEMRDFEGWTAGAFWEECKLGYHHLKDVERIAFVGDKAWEKGLSMFMKPFTGAKMKYFDASERQAAIDWITEGLSKSAAA